MGIMTAVFGALTVGLAVTTFIFYSQSQEARKQVTDLKAEVQDYVRDTERNSDQVRQLIQEAKKQQPSQSLSGYLQGQFRALSERITGAGSETPESLRKKIEGAVGSSNVLVALTDANNKASDLARQVKEANEAREQANSALKSAQDRIKANDEAHASTLTALNADVGNYRTKIDGFATDLATQVKAMNDAVEKTKRDSADELARLNDRIAKLSEELLVAQGKVRSLQSDRQATALKPGDEAALVDGEIVAVSEADSSVFINRGKNQRIVLGMTFEVYSTAQDMRLDSAGNMARGKSAIEITRVDDNSAMGRVIRTTRGNPIVRGDVFANAVYDPKKIYSFMVFGNFDTNGDRSFTSDESDDIKAMIKGWGGKTIDSISGDVDFVVLGARPALPPAPPGDAPTAVVTEFIRQRRIAQEYDRLLEQATQASIPVLNQNRLMTLIGQ
jgi:hypothetical protein